MAEYEGVCDPGEVCCIGYDYLDNTSYDYGAWCEDLNSCTNSYNYGYDIPGYTYSYDMPSYTYSYDVPGSTYYSYDMSDDFNDAADTAQTAGIIIGIVILILIALCAYCCCCKKQ